MGENVGQWEGVEPKEGVGGYGRRGEEQARAYVLILF